MGDESPNICLVMQEEGEERKPVRKAVTGCTRCQADIVARQATLNTTVGTGNQAEARGTVQKASTKRSTHTQEDARRRRQSGEQHTTLRNVLPPPQTLPTADLALPLRLLVSHMEMQASCSPGLARRSLPPLIAKEDLIVWKGLQVFMGSY